MDDLPSPHEPVELDGSIYEGGGGLIRYAINYASLLNKPIHIHSIRANRPDVQGLRSEHTVAITTLSQLASVAVEGNTSGSRELRFTPNIGFNGPIIAAPDKIGVTAEGAASILLIAILPYILFSQVASRTSHFNPATNGRTSELVIRAGTLCVKAPSIFYLRQVLLPTFKLIGIGEDNVLISEEHEQGWHTQGVKYPGKMVMYLKPLT
ncbi:hypothetical protein ANO14919_082360 [Xylariales sp. No.14919]|nr:hypothetical protein ANO14919_082360 [Xylariales sp. No.14919]